MTTKLPHMSQSTIRGIDRAYSHYQVIQDSDIPKQREFLVQTFSQALACLDESNVMGSVSGLYEVAGQCAGIVELIKSKYGGNPDGNTIA